MFSEKKLCKRLEDQDDTRSSVSLSDMALKCERLLKGKIAELLRRSFSDAHDDADDIFQNVCVKCAEFDNSGKNPIDDLPQSYLFQIAKNCTRDFVRTQYPHHSQTARILRYVAETREDLEIWRFLSKRIFGYFYWKELPPKPIPKDAAKSFSQNSTFALRCENISRQALNKTQAPILFTELVSFIASVVGFDGEKVSIDAQKASLIPSTEDVQTKLETESSAHVLLSKIKSLSLIERRVLLLGLGNKKQRKDKITTETYKTSFFRDYGITLQQLSKLVELKEEVFHSYVNRLPLSDEDISKIVCKTKTHVKVIRSMARKKLNNFCSED